MLKISRKPKLEARRSAFSHQLEAFEAAKSLPFAAIFHEQGLGKTKIGLDLVLFWLAQGIADSAVVVTKKGLIENWKAEVATHSHLRPRLLSQDRKANFYAFNSAAVLYLVHYEAIVSERQRLELFLQTRKVGVLLDEAHKIKNPDARVSRALHELSQYFVRRVIMSGTPVANRPFDLWSQIRFLDGGKALGDDFPAFKRNLDLSNDFSRDTSRAEVFASSVESVLKKTRSFTIRETKKSAGLSLPNKTVQNLECALEPRQAELYEQFRAELAAIVVQNGRPILDDVESILKRLLRLVQVASNPSMVDQSYKREPGKLLPLETLVRDAVDKGEKIIGWTCFIENADFLGQRLDAYGVRIVHGALGIAEREESLMAFKEDRGCRVLVATPGAAKEGLTLTVANHAVFYDRSFSLDDYLQAQDRIHRISQERACFVTNLVAKGTVDGWVDSLLAAKNLAAQLGQGDIDRSEYDAQADYAFGAMLRDVLGLEEENAT